MSEPFGAGTRIAGRYVLEARIGAGPFGEVWKANDANLHGRAVAVKLLKAESLGQPDAVARFEREAAVLALLKHPNVVAVLDRGEWAGGRYLVMELVEGKSLADWLKAHERVHALPAVHEVRALFDQICAGVEAAHDVRAPEAIVHRDLKPANVILAKGNKGHRLAKVLDFGLARLGARLRTKSGVQMGTLTYNSPEQGTGQASEMGPWSDVFSLGVILVEMLSLRTKVAGKRLWWAAVMQPGLDVETSLRALRADVPIGVWAVAAKALRREASERFPDAGAMRAALQDAWRESQPSRASAPARAADKAPLFSWLHLSDVHFGHKSVSHQGDQALVLNELRKDIVEQIGARIQAPDAILVTGDIAFSGTEGQYVLAKAWLLDLATRTGVSPDRIFVVPGNHDVDRGVEKSNRSIARLLRALREGTDDFDETLANPEDKTLLTRRMAAYLAFASSFPSLESTNPLFWSHTLATPSGLAVRLIGLNTALLAADDLDKGRLRIGAQALAAALTNLPENELTLVLSHHPFRDGWLADQGYVDSHVKRSAHIHLFGHVHEADNEDARAGSGTGLIRITAGAVHGDKLPAGVPASHGYSFATVIPGENDTLRLRVWPRRWSEKNKFFTVDKDTTPKDRDCAEHALPGMTFARTPRGAGMR